MRQLQDEDCGAGQAAVRFAPSPTGLLHRGHAFSALTAAATARETGGRFVLRIEDIDRARCRPAFTTAIEEDLAWLGLAWERPVLLQSERLDDYAAALAQLGEKGLLYRDFRSRREAAEAIASAPHGPAPTAGGPGPMRPEEEAARLAAGDPFAWRLSMAAARDWLGAAFDALEVEEIGCCPAGERGRRRVRPGAAGDIVLARKDIGVAYHLAVVVDDARQGISHVVRGQDLFEATDVQRLLQALLGLPTPLYRHHPLILGPDGRRLAKRDGGETLRALREAGAGAAQVRSDLGFG